jgi:adenosylhomocysteine nucleosidase
VALREEARAVRASLTERRAARFGPLRYETARWGDVPVALARTGIGQESATEKAALFIEAVRPDRILATGFAGGLEETAKCGEIFLAREVWEAPTPSGLDDAAAVARWLAPEPLVRVATRAVDERRARVGRLLTVGEPVATPAAKRALREAFGAQALDMESSSILRVADRENVPTLCVRAILDEVDDALPFDFGKILTPEGRVRPLRAAAAIATHPGGLRDLEVLRRRAARAAASLASFVPDLIKALAAPDDD